MPALAFPVFASIPFAQPPRSAAPVEADPHGSNPVDPPHGFASFRPQLSRNARKALRRSRPATVVLSINGPARHLYWLNPALRQQTLEAPTADSTPVQMPESASLYSLLARYLQHHTFSPSAHSDFHFTAAELRVLRSKGYAPESVQQWASCLLDPRCNVAAKAFEQSSQPPPLFLLLLFLRRKQIRRHALGTIIRHLDRISQLETLEWKSLQIITVRLLRHVRELWPESMPWLTSFFVTQSSRLYDGAMESGSMSPQMLSDLTEFCNNYLMLVCLPTSLRPIINATYQERAQFQLLQYMATRTPPIVVSQPGFRSVARNQLAHAKTPQEREWAELKGASWPPWKENLTAMDEDKGYEFGASRASQLLHRMYEAGYSPHMFEKVTQIYAGWDTDISPTIQTRTALPNMSSQYLRSTLDSPGFRARLWAGRIRTTRTRREAWACFLSHESSGEAADSEVYLAMFEKLHNSTVDRLSRREFSSDADRALQGPSAHLLPGDMKEVLPDPVSSLHNVYISEPVPRYRELLARMHSTTIKPSNRLLAFLLETCPEFSLGVELLQMARRDFNGGIGRILYGIHDNNAAVQSISGYFFTAIIRFLCRFGYFDRPPPWDLTVLSPEEHMHQLKSNMHYVVEYAHFLLVHYRPRHRPAWAALMEKLVHQRGMERAHRMACYRFVCSLLDQLEQMDLDVDDDMFRSACMSTVYAAQTVDEGVASIGDMRYLLSTGSSRLRTLFNTLVGANADMQPGATSAPLPHVPGPAELHAYVLALGKLRDYEGLYSFTTWLTKHRSEFNVRVRAQHGGKNVLFRMLIALRLAVDGGGMGMRSHYAPSAPGDIALLIKNQINDVEEWGGWPTQEHQGERLSGPPARRSLLPTVPHRKITSVHSARQPHRGVLGYENSDNSSPTRTNTQQAPTTTPFHQPSTRARLQPRTMASFFEQLWESIFTPGPTPTLLVATNASFAALQLLLFVMLLATKSIHFIILSLLCGGLWWSINWFAVEIRAAQAKEEEAKRIREARRGGKEKGDDADGEAMDTGDDTEVDAEVEQKRRLKPKSSQARASRPETQSTVLVDKSEGSGADDTPQASIAAGPVGEGFGGASSTGAATRLAAPADESVKRRKGLAESTGDLSTDSEWEKVSEDSEDK
ncbi:hypothetical protein TW65_00034 [Stemphylium lycopersici]|nr:hypothetical protein TW65_00034 [Stemphylium lycopersici]